MTAPSSGTNVIETMRDATSDSVSTTGSDQMNNPTSPGSVRNGRYAAMFVIVANRIAVASLVGPSHAAVLDFQPAASEFLIASLATTGSSMSRPSAMINDAIEIC